MLNKIINLINYFRVARYSLYRELKFFYEPPPKKVSEIQNYELKSKIVSEILKFNTKCNYFYENLSIIKELKIEGLWKYYILKYKKKQLDTYLNKNVDERKKISQIEKIMTNAAKIVLGKKCKMRVDFINDEKKINKYIDKFQGFRSYLIEGMNLTNEQNLKNFV